MSLDPTPGHKVPDRIPDSERNENAVSARRRIAARDRRTAAIHEAGHIVVGRKFGLAFCSTWIAPTDTDNPEETRTWIGRVEHFGSDRLTPLERSMVGCAGAAAESFWDSGYFEPEHWWDPEIMSPSDWRLCGCHPGEPDEICHDAIDRLQHLLADNGPLWGEVLREARRLIVGSRYT